MNLPRAAVPPNAKEGWGARGEVPFAPIFLGALLLVWPALLNGYPLVFSDTGGFLHQTLGPLMLWDKPWVYGPFLHLFHWGLTLWLPMAAQALIVSHLLWVTQRVLRGGATAMGHLVVCLVAAALKLAQRRVDARLDRTIAAQRRFRLGQSAGKLLGIHHELAQFGELRLLARLRIERSQFLCSVSQIVAFGLRLRQHGAVLRELGLPLTHLAPESGHLLHIAFEAAKGIKQLPVCR